MTVCTFCLSRGSAGTIRVAYNRDSIFTADDGTVLINSTNQNPPGGRIMGFFGDVISAMGRGYNVSLTPVFTYYANSDASFAVSDPCCFVCGVVWRDFVM